MSKDPLRDRVLTANLTGGPASALFEDTTTPITCSSSVDRSRVYRAAVPLHPRSSPFTGYAMHQLEQRDNFMTLTGQSVTKILWKEGDGMIVEDVHLESCRSCDVNLVRAGHGILC